MLPRELGMDRPYDDEDTWKTMPPRRAVAAAGLRVLSVVKCEVGNFQRCPYGRNWCGKYHPRPTPWGGVKVDDVAAKFPAGEIVSLRFWGVTMLGSRRRHAVFLVSPADFDLYEEMTGWSGRVSFKPEVEDRPQRMPSGAVECRNVQPGRPVRASAPARISQGLWGIDPQSPMWCETCEHLHPVIEHRNCRAVEGYGREITSWAGR